FEPDINETFKPFKAEDDVLQVIEELETCRLRAGQNDLDDVSDFTPAESEASQRGPVDSNQTLAQLLGDDSKFPQKRYSVILTSLPTLEKLAQTGLQGVELKNYVLPANHTELSNTIDWFLLSYVRRQPPLTLVRAGLHSITSKS